VYCVFTLIECLYENPQIPRPWFLKNYSKANRTGRKVLVQGEGTGGTLASWIEEPLSLFLQAGPEIGMGDSVAVEEGRFKANIVRKRRQD